MLEQPPAKVEVELTFTEPLPTMAYAEIQRGVEMFPEWADALKEWEPERVSETPNFCKWGERK